MTQPPDETDAAPLRPGDATEVGPGAVSSAGEGEGEAAEKEWWDDPALPWKHKPTRSDLWCWAALAVVGIFGLVLLPLRPLLIANPYIGAWVTGGRTAMVSLGAFLRVDGGSPVPYWIIGTLSLLKFDWVYWWAGRLWGESIISSFMGRTKGAQKRAQRALRITEKYAVLAILLTYLPIPFPAAVVYAAVGMARMRLWVFMLIHLVGAGTAQALYLWLGWSIGEPAVAVVKTFADYMWYLTIGILVVMLATWWWRRRSQSVEDEA